VPLIEYKCELCGKSRDEIMRFPIPTEIACGVDNCQGTAHKQMSMHGSYKINGNNSASVTPKKFRGR
jgi:hypothetical protein